MVLAAVRKAAEAFGALGCEVSPTITPYLSDDFRPAEDFYRVRVLTEMLQVQENLRANSKVIDDWTSPANNYSAAQLFLHEAAMMRLAEKAVRLLGDFDYLLLPTSPIPAFAAELPSPDPDDLFAPWCNTFLFNLADLPAISINCGFTPDGLPIGLQIVGKRFDDLGLLQMAFRYQNACPMECPWPLR
jgi:Asp-tRNA(Asn)/Glu-tRNA(Gln) amidotransferase A subunit family amidase